MDSQHSRVSPSQKHSNDTIPTEFPNPVDSFNILFQPNFSYFSHISHPFSSRFSYQALNNPNSPFDYSRTCTPPKERRNKVSNTQKSNSQTSCAHPNWSKAEHIALTKAWVYISVDADVSNGTKNTGMWNHIFETWKDNTGPEYNDVRNTNNLGCRWQKIQQDISKFHGFYEWLERHPRSRTTLDDMKREAIRMFENYNDNKPFKFEHCWEILKSNAKWCTTQLTKMNESNKN
ncbi:DNA binding [Abeliophyllum distichum]|uniref:DNA binding n=1 Tax=Abeliophyllum distichum TaxID=126358 RepID=A0ABD1PD39_9LAMI